jgi:hypothetical protein
MHALDELAVLLLLLETGGIYCAMRLYELTEKEGENGATQIGENISGVAYGRALMREMLRERQRGTSKNATQGEEWHLIDQQ